MYVTRDHLRPLLPYLHGRIYHRGDAEPQASEFRGPNIILYVSRAVSRQIEAPLAVEVHSPDDGEEGLEVREPSMSYGAIYKLHTVYGVFFMNFKEPDLPDRFRVDSGILDLESHETLNPHFRQIYLQFPLFYEGTG